MHLQVVGTASDKASDVHDSAYDAAGRASDGVQYAKDSAHHVAGKASDSVKYAQDTAAGKAQDARQAAGDLADRAQDTTEQARLQGESTWQKVKETASEMYGKVRGTLWAGSYFPCHHLCLWPLHQPKPIAPVVCMVGYMIHAAECMSRTPI